MFDKLTVAACLLPLIAVPALAAADSIPPEVSAEFLNGKPFKANAGGKVYEMTLKPGGVGMLLPPGSKTPVSGKWRLSGASYCAQWGKSPEQCYTLRLDGKAVTLVDSSGTPAGSWSH